MHDNTVRAEALHCYAAQFLVRKVHRISRLESNDFFPTAFSNIVTNLDGGFEGAAKVGLEIAQIENVNRARYAEISEASKYRDTRMRIIKRAVYLLRHRIHLLGRYLLDSVDIHNRDDRIALDIRVPQCNTIGTFNSADIVGEVQHRHRPEKSVDRLHFLRHAECVD